MSIFGVNLAGISFINLTWTCFHVSKFFYTPVTVAEIILSIPSGVFSSLQILSIVTCGQIPELPHYIAPSLPPSFLPSLSSSLFHPHSLRTLQSILSIPSLLPSLPRSIIVTSSFPFLPSLLRSLTLLSSRYLSYVIHLQKPFLWRYRGKSWFGLCKVRVTPSGIQSHLREKVKRCRCVSKVVFCFYFYSCALRKLEN